MAWKQTEGVRQDARGRLYRTLVNSRGKQDILYVQQPTAEIPAGYTVPVPMEQPKVRRTLKLNAQEAKRRLTVIEHRKVGDNKVQRELFADRIEASVFATHLRSLARSPDQGKTWVPIEVHCDYYAIWHKEAE